MAYDSIERLFSRRGEKVGPFITVENAVGAIVCAGPILLLETTLIWRAVLMLVAATLGVLITTEVRGMLFCERLLWRIRGEVRMLFQGRILTPDQLPGIRSLAPVHRAVAQSGVVRKVRRQQFAPAMPPVAVRHSGIVETTPAHSSQG